MLWADEIVVVDFQQHRRHAGHRHEPRCAHRPGAVQGFGDSRNQAIEACRDDGISASILDQRCTEAVRDEDPRDPGRPGRTTMPIGAAAQLPDGPPHSRFRLVSERPPAAAVFAKGRMRYTLEPVHEGYEVLSGKLVGALRNAIWQYPFRNLEEVIRKMDRYSSLGASKLAHTRLDGERVRPRGLGIPEALYFQGRIHRRLGRLRHRLRLFRGDVLPLRRKT